MVECFILLFAGLVYLIRPFFELGEAIYDGKKQGRIDAAYKELVATWEEERAAKNKFLRSRTRIDALSEIRDELDYIFGDKWYDWIELYNEWYIHKEFTNGHEFLQFKNVCYTLILAKWGKFSNVLAGTVRSYVVCGLSEEESIEALKRIASTAERLVSEKHPDFAYEAEMLISPSCMAKCYIRPRLGRDPRSPEKRLIL